MERLETLQTIAKPYATFAPVGAAEPVWNHDITLIPLDGSHTEYTDRVEIRAGWKTPFIWLWAEAFYAHRQRKWIKMLEKKAESSV